MFFEIPQSLYLLLVFVPLEHYIDCVSHAVSLCSATEVRPVSCTSSVGRPEPQQTNSEPSLPAFSVIKRQFIAAVRIFSALP